MGDIAIIGVGMSKFGFYPKRSVREMGEEAVAMALCDAGISAKGIEIGFCGSVGVDMGVGPSMMGHVVMEQLGITGIPITRVENMCASGSAALRQAWLALQSGEHDVALAVGVEKMTSVYPKEKRIVEEMIQGNERERCMGMFPPIMFAMAAKRQMSLYDLTRDHLSSVALKNRTNALRNPLATFHDKPIQHADVAASRLIADPLHLLDCCPECDGAAALILATESKWKEHTTKPVFVVGSAQVSSNFKVDSYPYMDDLVPRAAAKAYQMAGLGPADVHVAEVHDCFSIAEVLAYEWLGFCGRGEGGRLVSSGTTALGGALPVNTSGGLLSKGHPLGATGVSQVVELVWQLRGTATGRQVPHAKTALAHNSGGIYRGQIGNACVHILQV